MRKQERQSFCDPVLTGYAKQLNDLTFADTAGQREELLTRGPLRNVTFFRDNHTYRVRLGLGGVQCTLGITHDVVKAARFADMAKLAFWPYRLRDQRPPTDADLNFSLVQAEDDCATNGDAMTLLNGIQNHLLDTGVLQVNIAKGKESRRTVRGELIDVRADLENKMLALDHHVKAMGEANARFYQEIKKAFNHLLDKQAEDRRMLADAERQREELSEQLRSIIGLLSPVIPEEVPDSGPFRYTDGTDGTEWNDGTDRVL